MNNNLEGIKSLLNVSSWRTSHLNLEYMYLHVIAIAKKHLSDFRDSRRLKGAYLQVLHPWVVPALEVFRLFLFRFHPSDIFQRKYHDICRWSSSKRGRRRTSTRKTRRGDDSVGFFHILLQVYSLAFGGRFIQFPVIWFLVFDAWI